MMPVHVLEKVSDTERLIEREQKYFDYFKPAYNISHTADCPPGMKGRKFFSEHKRKISIANTG